jgi:hypothetical protein
MGQAIAFDIVLIVLRSKNRDWCEWYFLSLLFQYRLLVILLWSWVLGWRNILCGSGPE